MNIPKAATSARSGPALSRERERQPSRATERRPGALGPGRWVRARKQLRPALSFPVVRRPSRSARAAHRSFVLRADARIPSPDRPSRTRSSSPRTRACWHAGEALRVREPRRAHPLSRSSREGRSSGKTLRQRAIQGVRRRPLWPIESAKRVRRARAGPSGRHGYFCAGADGTLVLGREAQPPADRSGACLRRVRWPRPVLGGRVRGRTGCAGGSIGRREGSEEQSAARGGGRRLHGASAGFRSRGHPGPWAPREPAALASRGWRGRTNPGRVGRASGGLGEASSSWNEKPRAPCC